MTSLLPVNFLRIRESDGSPSVRPVRELVVPNGSLTDNGNGTVTLTTGGSPGGSSGQVQFNSAGAFGGAAALLYSAGGTLLTVLSQSSTDQPLAVQAASGQTANLQEWQSSTSAAQARVTAGGDFSRPNPSMSTSEAFGASAVASGHYSLALGRESLARNTQDVVVGPQATAQVGTSGCTVIGASATAASDAIAIGKNAAANQRGIVIGMSCTLSHGGAVMGLNGTTRQNSDFVWCWDTGAGTTTGWLMQGTSSTSTTRDLFRLATAWADSTDGTRKARAAFNVYDTAAREGLRIEASGSAPMIGFLGATAVLRQVVPTGSTTDDVITALQNLGLFSQT